MNTTQHMNHNMNHNRKGLIAFTGRVLTAVGEAIYYSNTYRNWY